VDCGKNEIIMRRIVAGIRREDGLISITELPETDPPRTADLYINVADAGSFWAGKGSIYGERAMNQSKFSSLSLEGCRPLGLLEQGQAGFQSFRQAHG